VKGVGFEQVVDRRVGESLSDEGALAGLAGPEKKDGTVLDEGAEIQSPVVHFSDTTADLHEIQQLHR
jgi:hypothetical protein